VGTLPVEGKEKQEVKRTNEIKTAIPLLETIDIEGKDLTADALLTQRELATYLVEKRKAHYYFTVKGNQPSLLEALEWRFTRFTMYHRASGECSSSRVARETTRVSSTNWGCASLATSILRPSRQSSIHRFFTPRP
jgi:hypothetical protein